MENILILDFDGPLFPDRIIRFHPRNNRDDPDVIKFAQRIVDPHVANNIYVHMDPVAVGILNRLHQSYPYEIVVSSTWAHFCYKDDIEELFRLNGLVPPMHEEWVTPRTMSSRRLNEIARWLKENPGYAYAILDDLSSFRELYNIDRNWQEFIRVGIDPSNIVEVNPAIGIEIEHSDKLGEIFYEQNKRRD